MVLRRRWFVLLPVAAGLLAVPVIAPLVPPKYRSETLILVVPGRSLNPSAIAAFASSNRPER